MDLYMNANNVSMLILDGLNIFGLWSAYIVITITAETTI